MENETWMLLCGAGAPNSEQEVSAVDTSSALMEFQETWVGIMCLAEQSRGEVEEAEAEAVEDTILTDLQETWVGIMCLDSQGEEEQAEVAATEDMSNTRLMDMETWILYW